MAFRVLINNLISDKILNSISYVISMIKSSECNYTFQIIVQQQQNKYEP